VALLNDQPLSRPRSAHTAPVSSEDVAAARWVVFEALATQPPDSLEHFSDILSQLEQHVRE